MIQRDYFSESLLARRREKPLLRFGVASQDGFSSWTITDRKTGELFTGSGYLALMAKLNTLQCAGGTTINRRFSLPCGRW